MSGHDWTDDHTVRITTAHTTDSGHNVWPGETFNAMSWPPDDGVEVKLAGDYVWIPASCFEVVS